eukprot:9526622-Karenia_brevis.AAC.1
MGWKVSLSEAKRLPFAKCFVSLGAQLDFGRMHDGEIVLSNKPGRIEVIGELIGGALNGGLRTSILLSIRGKVIYADGQLFGKLSAVVTRLISEW